MRSTTFHGALVAAARVAGCAALMACRPTVDNTVGRTVEETGGVVAGDTAAELLDTSTQPETDAQCETFLDEAFADWDWDWQTPLDPFKEDETVMGCCEQLAGSPDGTIDFDFPHRTPCCDLLDWQGPVACTPWGPPRPPSMPQVA